MSGKKQLSQKQIEKTQKKWVAPPGLIGRFFKLHPIIGAIIGGMLIISAVFISELLFNRDAFFMDHTLIQELLVYLLFVVTILSLTYATGFLDELYHGIKNIGFRIFVGGVSLQRLSIVPNKGGEIELIAPIAKEIQLYAETFYRVTTEEKFSTGPRRRRNNYFRPRRPGDTGPTEWSKFTVKESDRTKVESISIQKEKSCYLLALPALFHTTRFENGNRKEYLLRVKIEKGIFRWYREVYLYPIGYSF